MQRRGFVLKEARTRDKMSLLVIAALIIVSLLVLVVGGTQAAPPNSGVARPALAQVILDPTAMAWVSSVEPDTNFGGLGYAWVGYGQGTGAACCSALRGLVKFDLSSIPAGTVITDARLYATIWDAQGPPDHFMYWAGRANTRWTEGSVTWNNKPNATWGLSGVDISATYGQVSWDVTAYVQGMFDGSWVNHGFYLMRENDETDPQEHTRMFGLLQLVVIHETVTPTPTPTPQPVVQTSITDHADPVYAGDEVIYAISVRNVSDEPLDNVWLVDTVPEGTAFVEASGGGVFSEDGTVIWAIPALYPGATYAVDLTLRTSFATASGTVLTNRAAVSYPCGQAREVAIICTEEATETTTVNRRPATASPTVVTCALDDAGDDFNTATDIRLGMPGISAVICPADDEDWFKFQADENHTMDVWLGDMTADLDIYLLSPWGQVMMTLVRTGLADEHLTWHVEAGATGEWRLRIFGHPGVSAVAEYRLQVRVFPPTPTPTHTPTRTPTSTPTGTHTPSPTPTITPMPTATLTPELELEKWLEEDYLVAGELAHYTVRVTNLGPSTAHDVFVRDILPQRSTFDSADPAATPDPQNPRRIPWSPIAELMAGESAFFRVAARVSDNVPPGDTLQNQANVDADGVANVHADSWDTVAAPRLSISPRTITSPVIAGEDVTIRACVSNEGTGVAQNVVVTVSIPDGVPYRDSDPDGSFSPWSGTVTWTSIETLDPAPGACTDLNLTLGLGTGLEPGDSVLTQWTISADSIAEVTVDHITTVDYGCADVDLSWELTDDHVGPGDTFRLSATVGQLDPRDLHDLLLSFTVPDYLRIASWHHGCSREGDVVECPLGGEPGEYHRYVELRVPQEYLVSYEDLVMEVQAREMCTSIVEMAEVELRGDLTIDGLEITQSIQRYPQNNVRLLEGRKTWIRVYAVNNIGPWENVRCKLDVYRCNGSNCDQYLGELPPLADEWGRTGRTVNTTLDRGDATQGFFFGLHQDWATGRLALVPEINPEGEWGRQAETDYSNNVGETVHARFVASPTDGFAQILGTYVDPASGMLIGPPMSALWDDIDYIRGAFPFREFDDLGLAPPEIFGVDGFDLTREDHWDALMAQLRALHDECTGDPLCHARWALVLPEFPTTYGDLAHGGVGDQPGRDMIVDWLGRDTLAHESGHNYGLAHAPSTVDPFCDTPDPETIDETIPEHLEDYGLNVETLDIYPPETTADIMSYCAVVWPTIEVYDRIYDHFISAQQQVIAADADSLQLGLLVGGSLYPQGDSGVIRRAALGLWPGGPFDYPGSGPYSLELHDASENALFTRHFTSSLALADAGHGVFHHFKEILPPQEGMSRIVLRHGTKTLATRAISANAPQVTLLAPNGGEVITDTFEAQWEASDTDGDPLTFSVQISRDGGQGWLPLTRGLTETTYILDPDRLPGGDQARLRVIANDGVRTGVDVSDDDFSVPNHPPSLRITRPEGGARVPAETMLFLSAEAQDREDLLIVEQLQWHSDRDGALGTGREIGVHTLSVGQHTIAASVTDSGGLTASDSIEIMVMPPIPGPAQCSEWLVNGDFEKPGWGGWSHGGSPEPLITTSDVPTDTHVLLPGNPSALDGPSLSWVVQMVSLPEATVHAHLSFRYQVSSRDRSADYDWFVAAITGGEGEPVRALRMHGGQSAWQTATADLSQYAGQTIGLLFAVRNDGQAGSTWAYVDDVSLCVSAAPPMELDFDGCWLADDLADYAPAGLPDFDQRQSLWRVPDTWQWSHDGPAAVADLLWWRDSATEPGGTAPPAVSDGYPLVETYGVWDDHDPQNVPPLIGDLATYMSTNDEHSGTDLGDLVSGLNAYLAAKDLDDDYTLTLRRAPSFDWVREEVKQNRQVLLLLGFWELQPTAWRRIGGHYVAVAGAGCGDEDWIAFSDPFRDSAEAGRPGRMVPAESHGHAPDPPHTVHNDAAYVSHDVYGVMRTASGWGPQGYARWYADIANFSGLNFALALEEARASSYLNGDILTLADYALVLAPRSEGVTLRVSPAINRVRDGEQFLVEMEVRAGAQDVDAVNAYLDFDPAVLTVVDEEGNSAMQVTPGTALLTVTTNSVNNTTGWINFVANGDPVSGRFRVATVRFKAITTTLASQLPLSLEAPRASDVRLSGESVLDHLLGGLVTVRQGALVVGQAQMQRQVASPNASWSVPLMLTLSRAGEEGPAYAYSAVSNPSGAFAMPGVAAPGSYRARLKGLHTLRNLLPAATLMNGPNGLNMETLLEGDANNDNRIDIRDISLLAAAYGKQQGEPGFDPRADFNEDGEANAQDLELLQPNLRRRGDVLVGISPSASLRAGAATAAEEPLELFIPKETLAAGSVSLRLVPTDTQTIEGEIISLQVVATAGEQQVDGAQVYVDFEPAAMQFVDPAGEPAMEIEPGTALPTVLLNSVDPARGWAGYMASSLGSSPISGEFIVATLRFKVLEAGRTWVRFSFSDWRLTDMTYQAQSVLGSVEAAQVQATAKYDIYLPVILKQYNP